MLETVIASGLVAMYMNQFTVPTEREKEDLLTLTPQKQRELLRACAKVDIKDYERCKTRQLERATADGGRSRPTSAHGLYDAMDLGNDRLRTYIKNQRTFENREHWIKNRKTFREFTPTEDVNTTRRPYINDIRSEQLRCMTEVAPGRPRSMCLDELGNKTRQKMRAERGSMKYPAQ